jgi:hypothetical protein
MSPVGNQVFGWKGKFRWWAWSSWHGKIGLLNWTGGLHNWDAREQVDQWYEGETRECRWLAGTHSMAKLDFWLEKAGTSATDPCHHWLVYPTLLQCVHQRILITAPQLTQHNYHLYLLNPQGNHSSAEAWLWSKLIRPFYSISCSKSKIHLCNQGNAHCHGSLHKSPPSPLRPSTLLVHCFCCLTK